VLLQLPVLLLAVPLWWLLAPYGLRAIAMASAAVIFVRAVVIVGAGLRALGLRGGVLLPFIGRGLALGAVCAAAVELGRHAGAALHHPIATLLAGGLFGLGAALAMAAVFPSLLGPEARAVLLRLIPAIGPLWATVPSPEVRP
jgi:hypothetical protein